MENSAIDTSAATETCAAFTCEPKAFAAAATFLAKRVIEARNTYPILSHILIVADLGGTVTLTGTDLDQWATVTLPATVESPGAICIEAGPLSDAMAKVSKGGAWELRFTDTGDGRAKLSAGGNRGAFNLKTLPVDDFPHLAHPIAAQEGTLSAFTMPAARFLADLAALAPCQSSDETRYYLNGVALQVRDLGGQHRFTMAATDGHAIAISSRPIPAGAEALPDIIVPRKAVATLGHAAKLAGPVDGIEVEAGDKIRFAFGNVEIVAKLIDGTFPQWENLFTGALAPIAGEPCMFPELLPGAPVAMIEKLAKAGKLSIDWEPTASGMFGTVAGDDGLLFGAMAMRGDAVDKKGMAYQWSGAGDALAYLEALAESAGLPSGEVMAAKCAAITQAYGHPNDSFNHDGGEVYAARPWGRVQYYGPQLIQSGGQVLGLTVSASVAVCDWQERVQDWETLSERTIHHPAANEPVEGSYSIVMPRERAVLQPESFITGPDGVTYPVAMGESAIAFSKEQVRALVGESCFETMEISAGIYIVKWLWEQGDSRFLCVGKDGRFKGNADAHRNYITRAEIEAIQSGIEPEAVAVEAEPVAMPETVASAAPESESEAIAAPKGLEPVEALSEAYSEPVELSDDPVKLSDADISDHFGNVHEPDALAALAARLAAIEAVLAGTLATGSAEIPETGGDYAVSMQEASITGKAARTPAHERAVRRAWAMRSETRKAMACAERIAIEAKAQHKRADDLEGQMQREANDWEELQHRTWTNSIGYKIKRGRAVTLARAARTELALQRKMTANLHAKLECAQRSPRYTNDAGREGIDLVGREASRAFAAQDKADALASRLSEAEAARDRLQEQVGKLGDAMVAENLRANRAEVALKAVQARADGWPPAVRAVPSVHLSFAA